MADDPSLLGTVKVHMPPKDDASLAAARLARIEALTTTLAKRENSLTEAMKLIDELLTVLLHASSGAKCAFCWETICRPECLCRRTKTWLESRKLEGLQ